MGSDFVLNNRRSSEKLLSLAGITATLFALACTFPEAYARPHVNSEHCSLIRNDASPEIPPLSEVLNQAASRLGVKSENARCVTDPDDPFDPGITLHIGKFKGDCASSTDNRVPVILSESEHSVTIANFRHAGRWWIATIPKDGISHAFLQTGVFTGWMNWIGAAHNQFLLEMKPDSPIILHAQDLAGQRSSAIAAVSSIVISSDPIASKDRPMGNKESLEGDTVMVTRFMSLEERAFPEITMGGNKRLEQQELNLDQAGRRQLLETSLRYSIRNGYDVAYSVPNHNCASVSFDILDEAFPPNRPVDKLHIGAASLMSLNVVLGPTRKLIAQRGLAAAGGRTIMDKATADGELFIASLLNDMRAEDIPKFAARAISGTSDPVKRTILIDEIINRRETNPDKRAALVRQVVASAENADKQKLLISYLYPGSGLK